MTLSMFSKDTDKNIFQIEVNAITCVGHELRPLTNCGCVMFLLRCIVFLVCDTHILVLCWINLMN